MKNTIVISLLIMALLSLIGLVHASPSFYEVGDSNGWTTTMGVDYYKAWSSSKTFYVGDSLIFQYDKDQHNVLEVGFQDFKSCNPNSAIATYLSEYEPVILNRTGYFYFICGLPGHCESGQKLEVQVTASSLENTPTTPPSNPPPNPKPNPNPPPKCNTTPSSNPNPSPKPNLKPRPNLTPSPPLEDPLEVLPVDAATIASLPYNAASSLCVWSGLGMVSFVLLQAIVFL